MTTVDISRAAPLPTSPLTIYGSKAAGSPSLLRGGLLLPRRRPQNTFAAPSSDMHGQVLLSSRLDNDTLGLSIRLAAATETAFQALYTDVADAIGQFSYTATITHGAVPVVWSCFPGEIALMNKSREPFDSGLVVDYFTLSIPVYPIPGA